jgi:hypothetical protein
LLSFSRIARALGVADVGTWPYGHDWISLGSLHY